METANATILIKMDDESEIEFNCDVLFRIEKDYDDYRTWSYGIVDEIYNIDLSNEDIENIKHLNGKISYTYVNEEYYEDMLDGTEIDEIIKIWKKENLK